ncbi:MAG: P-type Ca2+ transporter type [Candidatus Atribacteria bacterium]|nr:P-type Ca2+ transporter type [Candidatus Atribacteria bacterium]
MAEKGVVWHSLPQEEVLRILGTDPERGLSSAEVKKRLTDHGANTLPKGKKKAIWAMFLDQFKDFLVIILIAACVLSVFVGEITDALVILAILVINAILGVTQEKKATQALEALKQMTVPECEVLREGKLMKISSEELVPGDIVLLREGDFIPADLRLLESHALRVDEASLTGESVPVEKTVDLVEEDVSLADRLNMGYSGTLVTYGRGKGVVVATGLEREIGKIAQIIEQEEEVTTPLQKRLAGLGKLLGVATIFICIMVFLLGYWRGEPALEMFMTAVSLAVAAIPEGLPAVVTIVLALGVYRMSQHNAIVRKLPSVETLGCATYVCTDKTGTLTENKMRVREFWVMGDHSANPSPRERLLQIASLCNDASWEEGDSDDGKWFGDPTEVALLEWVKREGLSVKEIGQLYPRVEELPFDSQRKMMSTLHQIDGDLLLMVKGAPDVIVSKCRFVEEGEEVRLLDESTRQEIIQKNDLLAEKALRVLGFAYKKLDQKRKISFEDEDELIFVGLVGMIDPPREEVKVALQEAQKAGIKTIMVTGDNARTAEAIARELSMFSEEDKVLTGPELAQLSWDRLKEEIKRIRVFARVWPEQKLNIVGALQENGEVVAMTGDGVNDAPALKKADIGIAMGITGTDVAKETADVVLTDDNFATIVRAIKEGRVIFDNIRKFVMYLLACNLGEIMAIFIPILLGLSRPLIPVQILLINLVTDGLPALALGTDSPEPDVMEHPPRNPKEGIINPHHLRIISFNSVFITLAVLLSFFIGLGRAEIDTARTMAFATLAFDELWRAYSFRSERRNFWQIDPRTNLNLVGAILLSFLVVLSTMFFAPLQSVFGTVKLNGSQWMTVIIFSLLPFVAYEIRKIIVRRVNNGN